MCGRAVLLLLAGLAVAAANSGCAQLEETRRYLTMNEGPDGTEEGNGEWDIVRKEGRGNKAPDVEPDGWFDNLFHSAKYREINRSLNYVSK